ncbi:MAG: PQQ-dependent sugar dehydrogenase [Verrucomicrobiota bacterium]
MFHFRSFATVLAVLLPLATSHAAKLPPGFEETRIASGLNPVTMSFAPDGRLFLCEKQGLLRVVANGKLLDQPALDLTRTVDPWNERGLLSVCFDPDFSRNGWIYIYHTHNRDPQDKSRESSNNRISRFTLKGDVADPASEKVIVEFDPLSKIGWHNGGGIAFGKDGMLYASTGENAKGPDAQSPANLLGKLMRFHKDGSIPRDNPFYQKFKGNNRAIVALGLRNPFSIAVRRDTGLLYLNSVGANYEQIQRYETATAPEPVNYGWPDIDGPPRDKATPADYRAPAYAYDHGAGKGVALCGGDFYQPLTPGPHAFPPRFQGHYFFGEYAGWIASIDPASPAKREDFASGINRALDLKFAPDGTLWYIERAGIPGGSDAANSASKDGSLWQVRWNGNTAGDAPKPVAAAVAQLLTGLKLPATAEGPLPATLSATGIFTDRKMTPRAGIVPYQLNAESWADGATQQRWVALPNGRKVKFARSGEFTWPGGTVFIQHFEMPGAAKLSRRLETRILVLDAAGGLGYGASYRWRADGSDADLVGPDGLEDTLTVTDAAGASREQTWSFPSRGLCFMCHTPAAGVVLGPKARQLNGDFTDANGHTANQLATWNQLGLFESPIDETQLSHDPKTCAIDDAAAPLEHRVRSYLDSNCAHCHRPGGTGAGWDARFDTPLAEQGILGADARNTFGIDGAKIIAPGNVAKSLIHTRMASTEPTGQMPPVTRNLPDRVALKVFEEWILQAR